MGSCRCKDYALDGVATSCPFPATPGSGYRCFRHGPQGSSPRFPISDLETNLETNLSTEIVSGEVPEEVAFYRDNGCQTRQCLRILPNHSRCENISSLFPYCPFCTAVRERVLVCVRNDRLSLVAYDELNTPVFYSGDVITDGICRCDVPNDDVCGDHLWKHQGIVVSTTPPLLGTLATPIGASRWVIGTTIRPTLCYAIRRTGPFNARMVGTALVASKTIEHGEPIFVKGLSDGIEFCHDIAISQKDYLWLRRPRNMSLLEPWISRLYEHACETGSLGMHRIVLNPLDMGAVDVLKQRAGPTHPCFLAWVLMLMTIRPTEGDTCSKRATWCVGVVADALESTIIKGNDRWSDRHCMMAEDIVDVLLTGSSFSRILNGRKDERRKDRKTKCAIIKEDSFLPKRLIGIHQAILKCLLYGIECIICQGKPHDVVDKECIRRFALIIGGF